MSKKLDLLNKDDASQDAVIEKLVVDLERDLSLKEKVRLYKFVMKELSYKGFIEHPEFMLRQNNVLLRTVFFGTIMLMFTVTLGAMLFSDGPFITSVINFFKHIFDIFSIG